MSQDARIDKQERPAIDQFQFEGPSIRRLRVLLLPCVLFALCAIPIIINIVPPLTDYPNHLARMYIITNPSFFSEYFYINWQIIPSLAMDVIVPILTRFVDIYSAGKLFILMTIFLITSGTFAVHYALYRVWQGPALCFLFVFNGIFLYGFLNYVFAIGVALWATAGWIALRNSLWPLRVIFSTCAILLLFFCHLGGVGLYALAVFCYELSRLIGSEWHLRRVFLVAAITVSPFLIIFPLMLASSTSHGWANTEWPMLTAKWVGPYLALRSTNLLLDGFFTCFLILFIGCLIYLKRVTVPLLAWLFVLVAGVTYLIIPGTVFNDAVVDIRLPVAFVFFLIAMMRWRMSTGRAAAVFHGIITALVFVRVIGVAEAWRPYGEIVSSYEESFDQIKPGARVLVTMDSAAGWQGSGNRVTINMDRLATGHFPALAVIERSCLVSSIFADPGKQILAIRGPYRDSIETDISGFVEVRYLDAPSEELSVRHPYLNDWRNRYDYIYVLYAPPGRHPHVPDTRLLYQGPSFQLYRVSRTQ